MTESKHTPGPWLVEFSDYGSELWFGGKGAVMYQVGPAFVGHDDNFTRAPYDEERMKADANLISAAPKMLKALELVAENTPLDNCSPFIAAVMDALESAKGVSE